MRRLLGAVMGLLLTLLFAATGLNVEVKAGPWQDQNQNVNQTTDNRRVMTVEGRRHRLRRVDRPRGRGIRSAFKKAGQGAGRGGKRLGTNVAHGRPVRGGKEFGKGMGRFGKYTGKGVARTTKRVVTP